MTATLSTDPARCAVNDITTTTDFVPGFTVNGGEPRLDVFRAKVDHEAAIAEARSLAEETSRVLATYDVEAKVVPVVAVRTTLVTIGSAVEVAS